MDQINLNYESLEPYGGIQFMIFVLIYYFEKHIWGILIFIPFIMQWHSHKIVRADSHKI